MAQLDLLIRADRAVIDGVEQPAAIGVRAGSIVMIAAFHADLQADRVDVLADNLVLIPGLVDTHVHINEPGHPDWENFDSATRAAAAGGITTLVDMPLDSVPVTTTVSALQLKRAAAAGQCHVDVGFWGGLVPDNLAALPALDDAGVLGFKCFLGSATAEFPPIDDASLVAGLASIARLNSVLLVHAELDEHRVIPTSGVERYSTYLASRPPDMETSAVERVIEAAHRTGGRAHIAHVSSAAVLANLHSARETGVDITAETCPHYLVLSAEEIPDGGTAFACSPPIRDRPNQDALWNGLATGTITMVVSDHSPVAATLKHADTGDFEAAWGGISSLQLSLPLVWTAARRRGVGLPEVLRWMSREPAQLAGLSDKGAIGVGYRADFAALDPEAAFAVRSEDLHHLQPVSPYLDRTLHGVIDRTWLGGQVVSADSRDEVGAGRLLRRQG